MTEMNHEVYIASPLFHETDHSVLDKMEQILDEAGVKYFSPRRDSNLGLDLRGAKTPEERDAIAQKIFDLNKEAVASSKLLVVNTIGTFWNNAIYADAGTMVEAGLAFALNIPVITFNFHKYGLNIMLSQEVVYHCDNTTHEDFDELKIVKEVLDYINSNPEITPSELRSKFFTLKDRELV